MRWSVVAVLIGWALSATQLAHAQCDCENGDGQFTTHSGIAIDGSMTDWSAVLGDPDNNSCDGGDPDVPPQPDRDAPVQSTGRDLAHFAYTWDNTHVQTYTVRIASSSNVQRFIYYADTNNDGTMDTGERVIVVAWKGSNRLVELFLGTYVQVAADGDSMVDGSGYGDGYTLPGSVSGLPSAGQPHYSGNWGSTSGVEMEWQVPFADSPGAPGLGIAPGAPFKFHVSSTNSTPGAGSFPAQVDDNMAGCGGGPASTQYAGVQFTPDRSFNTTPSATEYAAHVVTNTGNGTDAFDLGAVASGAYSPTVAFYHDADGSGTFTGGDTLLTDTTSDGFVDTGNLAASASINLLIAYGVPGGASGVAMVAATATSDYNDQVSASVSDTLTVPVVPPSLTITKISTLISDPVNNGVDPKHIPLALLDYTITVTNSGGASSAGDSVVVADILPPTVELYVGDLDGNGPADFDQGTPSSGLSYSYVALDDLGDGLEFSEDYGATWDYEPDGGLSGFDPLVTNIRVHLVGPLAAAGGGNPSCTVRFRVRVR